MNPIAHRSADRSNGQTKLGMDGLRRRAGRLRGALLIESGEEGGTVVEQVVADPSVSAAGGMRIVVSLPISEDTLAAAVALRSPVLVEVDCEAFGPMPKPFVPPVAQPNPSGG